MLEYLATIAGLMVVVNLLWSGVVVPVLAIAVAVIGRTPSRWFLAMLNLLNNYVWISISLPISVRLGVNSGSPWIYPALTGLITVFLQFFFVADKERRAWNERNLEALKYDVPLYKRTAWLALPLFLLILFVPSLGIPALSDWCYAGLSWVYGLGMLGLILKMMALIFGFALVVVMASPLLIGISDLAAGRKKDPPSDDEVSIPAFTEAGG